MVQLYCAQYVSRSFHKAPWSWDACTGHIQTTKGGVGPAKTTTKPWGQHTSTKSLSSCGSPVQERKKKCPGGKKSQASQMKIPKKEKNYVWCFGWLRLHLAKIDGISQSSARRHYVQGLQLQSTWFWCGIVNFQSPECIAKPMVAYVISALGWAASLKAAQSW